MKQHAETRDTAPLAADARLSRLAAVATALALLATPAVAGDRALIEYLGYSEDGRYFAFEEFGVQDGSGFPYANIYIVDLPADTWVTGSPYKVLLQEDESDPDEAREQAFEMAEAKLDELEISAAAHVIALNGDGEPEANVGHELVYGDPGYGLGEVMQERTLILGIFPRPSGAECAVIDDETFGFSLSLDGVEIYADGETLPESRSCPMGYKIHSVVRPAEWSLADGGTVVIVATYPYGFEGPDRRFLAIPLD
jgi:predicted secreted protein